MELSTRIEERQAEIDEVVKTLQPLKPQAKTAEKSSLSLEDQKLIDLMLEANNRAKTKKLWSGDTKSYASPSEADQALCSCIAFYTQDPEQIDRIFKQSGLYRPKWDREDYRQRTIHKATSNLRDVYLPIKTNKEKLLDITADPQTILGALDANEDGDAWLFGQKFEGKFCYDHATKGWFKWNGYYWELDKTNQARAEIKSIIRLYGAEAKSQTRLGIKASEKKDESSAGVCAENVKALLKRVSSLQAVKRKDNVLKLAGDGDNLGIAGDEWDRHPMWLPCKNGIIDLETGELFEGKPEQYIKTVANVGWNGIDKLAPRWEEFLNEVFNFDQELIDYVNRLLGYSITGKTTEHIHPIAWGDGRNGKGTLFETLGYILGELARPIEPEMILQQSFARKSGSPSSDIMFLRGKRLVWASEVSEGRRLDTGKLKWLTGGDTLTGRVPYGKRQISFRPTHKLFLLTNHKPHAPSSDFALWQRIHLIPFKQAFVVEPKAENEHLADPEIAEKLRTEAPGILAWLVRGCLEWQRQGLKPPEIVKTATEEYRQSEDLISHFIADRCSLGAHKRTKAGELYKAYVEWCNDMGHKPMTGTRFGREIGKSFDSEKDMCGKYYLGIEINPATPQW